MSFQLVYLTGAPAAGKSTVTRLLTERLDPLMVFDYGEELRQHVSRRAPITYDELRHESGAVVTPEDVAETDLRLLEWTRMYRPTTHLVIDTHAVTREPYGFRVTAFDAVRVRELAPTLIVMLYVNPEVSRKRIAGDPGGRRGVDEFEAGFHTALQGAVAVSYGIHVGRPVYLIDSSLAPEEVADEIANRVRHAASESA